MVREEIVFGHDKCLCMRAYVEHRRVDTQQAQEPFGAAKCGESKVLTMQMMMTLILTASLRVKTNTD